VILLDLYCGAGGASKGYVDAGFQVVGVDSSPQPRYPYRFIQQDALVFLDILLAANRPLPYAAVHASPPCQAYSDLQKQSGLSYPKLIEPTRERLEALRLPYVIENVEGAPLRAPTTLCGTMFPGLRVIRHRLFESNVELSTPPHGKHPLVFTYDKRKAHYGKLDQNTAFVQVTGGGNCTVKNARDAMGIDWMIKDELNEAIPPAYTELVGKQLLTYLKEAT
jgi:DNA (cytosine-5)-methyltransferase 1